jgi:hypothetical protein
MAKVWTLRGYDTFEGEYYDLPGEYASEEAARTAGQARLQHLEVTQPSEHSGGQGPLGIQDRVYLVFPGRRQERLYPEDP